MLPTELHQAYVFDLDGTIYLGDHLLPGAARLIGELRRRGIPVRFLSNNPTKDPRQYVEKLTRLGLPLRPRSLRKRRHRGRAEHGSRNGHRDRLRPEEGDRPGPKGRGLRRTPGGRQRTQAARERSLAFSFMAGSVPRLRCDCGILRSGAGGLSLSARSFTHERQ